MRKQHLKLKVGKSTKSERIFMEILKSLHIPFRCKVMLYGREVDFLIGKHIIEINGHEQDTSKNSTLLEKGYSVIHYDTSDILTNREEITNEIKHKKLTWLDKETQN